MRSNTIKRLVCAALSVVASVLWIAPAARADQAETVTVAYIDYNHFIDQNADGSYSGYGADYLARIAEYTGWRYEYVSMDWPSAYAAVRDGTVDFYCVARQTDARYANFSFSLFPVCNEEMNLYTLPDSGVYFEDYQAFDGMRVGVLAQSGEAAFFSQYAALHGFECEFVEYPMNERALAALQNGEVDAVALVNYSVTGELNLVAHFGVSPAYMMSSKNSALMAAFCDAQMKLHFDDPDFAERLTNQYYADAPRHTGPMLTREEAAYIENAGTLTVGVSLDMAPMEYYDESTDAFCGVTVDLYKVISELTGLQFQFVRREDAPTLIAQMERGEVHLLGAMAKSRQVADALHIAQTVSYYENTMSMVTVNFDRLTASSVVAIPAGYPQFIETARQNGYSVVNEYSTFEACVNAVSTGEADLAFIISMCEGYLLDHARYTYLRTILTKGTEYGVCLGVSGTADPRLLSILNKCILSISVRSINEIVVSNTAQAHPPQSITDFLARNQAAVLIIVVIVVIMLILSVARRQRARQQKALTRQLKTHRDFLQHLYDTLPCGVFQYGYEPPHHIISGNSESARIYRVGDKQSFTGKAPGVVVKANARPMFLARFAQCEKAGEPILYDRPIVYADGTEGCVECVMDLVQTEQGKVFQEVFIDVTESRRAQRLDSALAAAEKADAAKSQFLSRVSHEIRTPLNAIIGFIELAKDANQTDLSEYLANSDVAAKQLLGVINDVLDMSSIESGKLLIAKAPFHFSAMISSVTKVFGMQCGQKGIEYRTIFNTAVDDWLVGDELRIKQILINLLGNAVKFTSEGHIYLRVAQDHAGDKDAIVRFQVSDTGCGMSDEFISRLFRPFEQENSATAIKYGGSGLGLSIVKNLIGLMGGSIRVESALGAGTTFFVELPLCRRDPEAPAEPIAPVPMAADVPAAREWDFSGKRVLLVEDNPLNRVVEQQCLLKFHLEIDMAENGLKATEMFTASEPGYYDVILMDIQMPVMNGYEAAHAIRLSEHPDAQRIHIIAQTADAFDEDVKRALSAGMNAHISKPIILDVLAKALDQAFTEGA